MPRRKSSAGFGTFKIGYGGANNRWARRQYRNSYRQTGNWGDFVRGRNARNSKRRRRR